MENVTINYADGGLYVFSHKDFLVDWPSEIMHEGVAYQYEAKWQIPDSKQFLYSEAAFYKAKP